MGPDQTATIYCIFLLTLFDLCKNGDKQCGPRSDCSYMLHIFAKINLLV